MDCGETYVKMCQKAWILKDKHQWAEGDWFWASDKAYCIGSDVFGVVDMMRKPSERVYLAVAPEMVTFAKVADVPDRVDMREVVMKKARCANPVWLPRQDQLQGIVSHGSLFFEGGGAAPSNLCGVFDLWVRQHWIWGKSTDDEVFASMEQLWLAFVMAEKYGKRWNGGDWA
jgi:hypothetical protein